MFNLLKNNKIHKSSRELGTLYRIIAVKYKENPFRKLDITPQWVRKQLAPQGKSHSDRVLHLCFLADAIITQSHTKGFSMTPKRSDPFKTLLLSIFREIVITYLADTSQFKAGEKALIDRTVHDYTSSMHKHKRRSLGGRYSDIFNAATSALNIAQASRYLMLSPAERVATRALHEQLSTHWTTDLSENNSFTDFLGTVPKKIMQVLSYACTQKLTGALATAIPQTLSVGTKTYVQSEPSQRTELHVIDSNSVQIVRVLTPGYMCPMDQSYLAPNVSIRLSPVLRFDPDQQNWTIQRHPILVEPRDKSKPQNQDLLDAMVALHESEAFKIEISHPSFFADSDSDIPRRLHGVDIRTPGTVSSASSSDDDDDESSVAGSQLRRHKTSPEMRRVLSLHIDTSPGGTKHRDRSMPANADKQLPTTKKRIDSIATGILTTKADTD